MAGFDFAFLELLFRLMARQTGQISRVDFTPQKPHYRALPEEQPLPRATPESQGVSSAHIMSYLKALKEDPEANPHHAIVMRHGYIIAECAFAPYQKGMWHITHSMCKSFTGMAVGLAIQEGALHLDDKIDDIFPQSINLLSRLGRKDVTIRNLLNMTSEVDFYEAGAISGNEWLKKYMSAGTKCDPGTKWDYNSMNSYVLSAAVQEKTGENLFDYLNKRVFTPLGITEVFWEKSPEGITKGGWGMFIRPEDACKLGLLYLNHGVWNGTQIIPEDWVLASTKPQADNGKYGYGYQIWMEERPGGYAYNGLFGQDVVIYPDDDMIIMVNAGNREMTQSGNLTEIMRRYFGISYHPSDDPLPEDPEAQRALSDYIALCGGKSKPETLLLPCAENENAAAAENRPDTEYMEVPDPDEVAWAALPDHIRDRENSAAPQTGANVHLRENTHWQLKARFTVPLTPSELTRGLRGKTFRMDGGQIGIFPLICQVMHYNFTDGIKRIGFDEMDGRLMVLFYEGNDIHHVTVGFGEPAICEIVLHGEPYYIGTEGRIAADEDNHVVLILKITFIEEACSRELRMHFAGENLILRANEAPGEDVIADSLKYTGENPDYMKLPFVKTLVAEGGLDILNIAIQATVHPTDTGHMVR